MASTRVNEIDLLRFLAAFSVVLFHFAYRGYAADSLSVMPYPLLAPIAKYGYLGVELFFMISGFVILMSAGNGNLKSFLISRVVRLYPAFWVCCTITFVATLAFGASHFTSTLRQYLGNMTLMGEFIGAKPLDGAYWSLFLEIRFYAMVLLLMAFRKVQQSERFILLWLVVSSLLEIKHSVELSQFLVTDYAAFFSAGALFFRIWSQGFSVQRLLLIVAAWSLAVVQTLRHVAEFKHYFHTELSSVIVLGVITAFFLLFFLIALKKTGEFGKKRWVLLGSLTYPLYLVHQNVGFMLFNAFYPRVNAHVLLWTTVAFVVLLAAAIHFLLEKPLSALLKKGIKALVDRPVRLSSSHRLEHV